MSPAEILAELRDRSVVLESYGENLHYRAPMGVLTPVLLEALRENKTEILKVMAGACACPYMGGPAGVAPRYRPCATCGLVRRCKVCGGCRRCRLDNPLRDRVFPGGSIGDGP